MGDHLITRLAADFGTKPAAASSMSEGLSRQVVVGRATGAVHTELAIGAFRVGGWLRRHVHSFEEALYVLAGELAIEIDGTVHRLVAGDFALMPVGVSHALANAGDIEVRFLSVNTPQRLPPDAGRTDTFFEEGPFAAEDLVGRARRTPPQADALAVADAARGRAPAGMDTAILAYSGISVKMLVDRTFGADLLTMFTVDYEPGGAAQAHDHPFEETYVFLTGEIEAELDGETVRLGPGDIVFAGVGSVHGFYNVGKERVRWIETQAPQPPVRHAYRWRQAWRALESR
jgi:quercetin dioxygenase-like cupin family protein